MSFKAIARDEQGNTLAEFYTDTYKRGLEIALETTMDQCVFNPKEGLKIKRIERYVKTPKGNWILCDIEWL